VKIDLETGATTQFVYPLTNIGTAKKPKYPTVREIVAINSHEFLVDKPDGTGQEEVPSVMLSAGPGRLNISANGPGSTCHCRSVHGPFQ
jgi:hypothetical protein